MAAVVANPQDATAVAVLARNRNWHAMLRTTCISTILSAGHATNALPQRAPAISTAASFPGWDVPLTPKMLHPVETVAHQLSPGVPVVPALEPAASDAQFMNPAGIPTYGITGFFTDPDGGNIHGLDEQIRGKSVYEGRTFLYRLIKLYFQ